MEGANHYQVLGVSFGATSDEIRAAYTAWIARLRENLVHGADAGPDMLDRLRAAYRTLSDPAARSAYDASLAGAPTGGFPGMLRDARGADAGRETDSGISVGTVSAAPMKRAADAAMAGEVQERHPFEFAGSGSEYFRIWIVNLLLSIITLGIYSAWAKVRREQYFHRNLLLDGSGFDYHGEAIAILKGRIIAFLLFVGVSVAQAFGPVPYLLSILALLPLIPWLIVRAFRFRAHNTSYRGLRLSFHGTYVEALKVFLGYGLLSVFTLGLAFPLFLRAQKTFVLNHLRFGSAPLACSVGVWPFYRLFLLPIAAIVLLVVAVAVAGAGLSGASSGGAQTAIAAIMVTMMVAYLVMLLVVVPYVTVQVTNLVWNNAALAAHRFESSLGLWGYIGVVVSNGVLTLLTLGLFWPWAKVRMARYRASHLALLAAGSLDAFVAGEATNAAALGDEAAEMFDMDVAL